MYVLTLVLNRAYNASRYTSSSLGLSLSINELTVSQSTIVPESTSASPPQTAATETTRQSSRVAQLIVLLAYVCLISWLATNHEIWRDEADVWLMARDNSFGELLRLSHYHGSPLLWHLLLWPFAKLGAPVQTMAVINASFAFLSAAVLLIRAPFSTLAKTLILLSYVFSMEYPVIARSYQLSVLLIFLLAALHTQRKEKPVVYSMVLGLLANTNVHGLVVACSIAFCNIVDLLVSRTRLTQILKFALPVIVAVALAVVQLIPPADGQFEPSMLKMNWWVIALSIRHAFMPSLVNIDHATPPPSIGLEDVSDLIVPILCIAGIVYLLRRSTWGLSAFCLSSLGLMSLFVFKYAGHVRHWAFFVVMAIYAVWVSRSEVTLKPLDSNAQILEKQSKFVIGFALVLSVMTGFRAWGMEFLLPFSDGEAAANFLKMRNLDKLPIAAYKNYAAESLAIHLPNKKFFYPEIKAFGTNMKWNKDYSIYLSNMELLRRLNDQFGDSEYLLLLSDRFAPGFSADGFEQIYKTRRQVITTDERYRIFLKRKVDR